MGICGVPDARSMAWWHHRDTVQSEAEKVQWQQVALCCSRSHSGELVIGL
jgi:vanillate O-demethylase ferredoxin subunit